jgi:hypothetical protein
VREQYSNDLKEITCKDVDWIPLAPDRNQWHHNKHSSSIKGSEFFEQLSKYYLVSKDYNP